MYDMTIWHNDAWAHTGVYKPETQISKSPVSRKLQFTCSKVYGTTPGVAMVTSASELLMTILDST